MEFDLFREYGPALLRGLLITIFCWIVGTICGMALGFVLALIQRSVRARPVQWLLRAYVEFIRGTPFLVQLFVLYYGMPMLGLRLDAMPAGLLGLTVYGSAYFAEIFRAGLNAVPVGQIEAARAMGFAPGAILRRVMIPVMLVSALPALVNFSIILTKETVILSMITVPEIMFETQTMMAETFAFAESTLVLALFFWVFVEAISRAGRRLERRATHYLLDRS
jgi:polar amino acid transport system permease protein